MNQAQTLNKKKMAFPNTWIIIAAMVAIVAILTWIVPPGAYDYESIDVNGTMRNVAIDGSYHRIDPAEANPTGFLGVFSALYSGCVSAADIIFVILCCSGTFGVMVKTGAFHAGIGSVVGKFGKKSLIMVPVLMIAFGVGGSAFGMLSEFYGFYPLIVGLGIALGYDAMFGFAIIALGEYIGFMGATLNPYTVAVAQSVSGVPLYSGTPFRVVCFFVFIAIAAIYLIRYGMKIQKDPTKSVVYGRPCIHSFSSDDLSQYKVDGKVVLVLLDLLVTLVVLMLGLMKWSWGYKELCGLFIIMSIFAAAVYRWNPNEYVDVFVSCARNVLWGAMLAGLAKGIMVVMTDGQIIDTIIYSLAGLLKHLPPSISAQVMLVVQTLVNFPVNSGSGQAVVMMPIMAPLADTLDLSRQVACLAFQFGDGLSNLLWPTGGIVIVCGLADIPYQTWLKWFMPLFGILFVAQMVLLEVAVLIGF